MKFFMDVNNEEDKKFAKRYTLSKFELSRDKIKTPIIIYDEEKERWVFRTFNGIDIFLNEDEAVRLIGCFMCNKIKINNWARYCNSECPYYFNTKSLKQIFGLNPIERRELIDSN